MTRLDTASNYLRHRSHQALRTTAGDLLTKFSISTKVGFFPEGHSLDPARLRTAVEQAIKDLGREPDLVFLHNPEHSEPDAETLALACATLADTVRAGLCRSWGVSTWNPRPLPDLDVPRPDVLMVRAGLLVGIDVLEAAEALVARWRPSQIWGMSPFNGGTAQEVWERFDPAVFLRDHADATRAQAVFRSSYALPRVDAVAVGTDSIDHLRELTDAVAHELDESVIREYRQLLKARQLA